jgi:hypothetical protein
MNRVRPISGDLNERKTDYTELNKQENTNPLRPGETANYQEVVDKQMAESEKNAARIFPKEEEAPAAPAPMVAEDSAEVEDFALPAAQDEEAETVTPPSQEEEAEEVAPPSQEEETEAVAVASQTEEAEEVVPPSQAEEAEEVTPPSQAEEAEEVVPPSQAEDAEEVTPPSQAANAEETAQAVADNPNIKTVFSETTVFADIVPEGLGFPKPNDVVDALTAKAEEEKAQPQPAEDTNNLYQMRRASDAYEMTMGLDNQ